MARSINAVLMLLAWSVAFSGCTVSGLAGAHAEAPQVLLIKGSLTYSARVTLPPETRAIVELKDTSVAAGGVIAQQRIDLQGRQVPVPFELEVDRAKLMNGRKYSVRAVFQLRGRLTWVSDPVLIAHDADLIDVGLLEMKPFTALAFTSELQCGDRKVTIGFVGNVMRLTAGNQSFDMRPMASASGAKYEAVGDSSTTLWTKGTEATVAIKGISYPTCTKSGASAPYRESGNEPGSGLDNGEAEIVLLADYGRDADAHLRRAPRI
jgi:uncharacterized lipoprotein YbaY